MDTRTGDLYSDRSAAMAAGVPVESIVELDGPEKAIRDLAEKAKRGSSMTDLELEAVFTYHAPKGDQVGRYHTLRELGKTLALAISRQCPDSREKSLALTKVREAIMWANAAIACNE